MLRLLRTWWQDRRTQRALEREFGKKLCPRCAGSGRLGPPGSPTCPSCLGDGVVAA
jgi:hypothetical protein